MKKMRRHKKSKRSDRGSALLVSLMVMVGLSLLGLAFVAISETESAIAKNQSQALQTLSVAEAGAKMVVEWFQSPAWARLHAGLPANAACAAGTSPCSATTTPGQYMKTYRTSGAYTGFYKSRAGTTLFDKPYRPSDEDRLFGTEATADIIINNTTNPTAVAAINDILLGTTATDKLGGEVTEIKVYAPPIVAGTVNSNGFWEGGQRYGVATIKVTAQLFQNPTAKTGIIASHSVRLVVGELPLPIPAGPIQGNANVSFGGSFFVHWGMETSRLDLTPSRPLSSLPWANAYERPHFEHGYEPGTSVARITITQRGSGYISAPVPNIPVPPAGGTQATATATVTSGAVTSITINVRGSGYPQGTELPITFTGGGGGTGAAATAHVGHEIYYRTGGLYDNADYFHEILGKQFDDPWYGARAVQDNMVDGTNPYNDSPQAYTYAFDDDEESSSEPSYAFQWQDANTYPTKKKVVFPTIRYDYWKRIAQQGRGYKGLYYFNHVTGGEFQKFKTGASQPMSYWANSLEAGPGSQLGPGVYFFDTKTGTNPQTLTGVARTNALTAAQSWNSSSFNGAFLMQGFVYMNATSYGTTGGGNSQTPIKANFPGESFRDIGYAQWNTTTSDWNDCGGIPCRSGAGDGTFSCQDLNNNGKCDIIVMSAPAWTSNDSAPATHTAGSTWIPKVWKSNPVATADYGTPCTIPAASYNGQNPVAGNCSEPHEPYLNFIYPDVALLSNNNPAPIVVGWENPTAQTYRAKAFDATGVTPVTCPAIPTGDDCTTNSYDLDGAIVDLEVILYGILYNEGEYGSQGNVDYFGSVLIQEEVTGTGTADVWFDEKLLKGTWAPPNMPRVIVFSEQTDEQSQ